MRASRVFVNGMAVLIAPRLHILSVLVSLYAIILRLQLNFLTLVLDPNVKDLYFRGEWDSEQYAAGMKQLEEVVGHSLYAVLPCATF